MSDLGLCKPQVEDPGIAHTVEPGKHGGVHERAGQPPRTDSPAINDHQDLSNAGFRVLETSNPRNGSGGSSRVISPDQVKGINP